MKVKIFNGGPKDVQHDLKNFFELLANFSNVRQIMQSESSTSNGLINLTVTIFYEG